MNTDQERIFKQVNIIREKQTELASEHISLELTKNHSMLDMGKRETELMNLMSKLDTLGHSM
ncbi:hypothetical protein BDB01DRAFT_811428 [Pilobolus umbonatus]|nr:hypothetical protein BDB01DRAFT_811428 [Pilobolus umbonatus]